MSFLRVNLILIISLLTICFRTHHAIAKDAGDDLQSQVKSAYIFKFANYITWPEKSFADLLSPVVIGVVDDEVIATELEKIAGSYTAANRTVLIRRLTAKQVSPEVHILYLNATSTAYLEFYQKMLHHPSTLYITDTVEGLNLGGVINFVRDDNRIRFDVSLPAAEKNKIKLDGSLLTVARNVLK